MGWEDVVTLEKRYCIALAMSCCECTLLFSGTIQGPSGEPGPQGHMGPIGNKVSIYNWVHNNSFLNFKISIGSCW